MRLFATMAAVVLVAGPPSALGVWSVNEQGGEDDSCVYKGAYCGDKLYPCCDGLACQESYCEVSLHCKVTDDWCRDDGECCCGNCNKRGLYYGRCQEASGSDVDDGGDRSDGDDGDDRDDEAASDVGDDSDDDSVDDYSSDDSCVDEGDFCANDVDCCPSSDDYYVMTCLGGTCEPLAVTDAGVDPPKSGAPTASPTASPTIIIPHDNTAPPVECMTTRSGICEVTSDCCEGLVCEYYACVTPHNDPAPAPTENATPAPKPVAPTPEPDASNDEPVAPTPSPATSTPPLSPTECVTTRSGNCMEHHECCEGLTCEKSVCVPPRRDFTCAQEDGGCSWAVPCCDELKCVADVCIPPLGSEFCVDVAESCDVDMDCCDPYECVEIGGKRQCARACGVLAEDCSADPDGCCDGLHCKDDVCSE